MPRADEVDLTSYATTAALDAKFDTSTGHDHDGVDSKLLVGLGAWANRNVDEVYLAATDGFVTATRYTTAQTSMVGYTDGGTPPTTVRAYQGIATTDDKYQSITFPVKKNNYYSVTGASVVYWIPLGS